MKEQANQTVELVRRWGVYEKAHPGATLHDFFSDELAGPGKDVRQEPVAGQLVPDINGRLMIMVRRIGRYHMFYSKKALAGTGLLQIEEFGILVTIFNAGNPIKSDVIFSNLMELSSGTNMLTRMKKRMLISEYADAEDKRVKRLKVTAKGERALNKAKPRVLQVVSMMLRVVADPDKRLCMQLLQPVNALFEGQLHKQKNKSFDQIFAEMHGA